MPRSPAPPVARTEARLFTRCRDWRTWFVRWLCVVAWASPVAGCGAGDAQAPDGPPTTSCPTLADRTEPLVAWVDQGRLDATGALLRDDLDAEVLRALTRVLLDVLAELSVGTLGEVGVALAAFDHPDVHALMTRLLDPLIVETPAAEATLLRLGDVVARCGDERAMRYLATLAADPRLASGLGVLLEPAAADALLAALTQNQDATTRAALVGLLGNALRSMSLPNFDPDPLRSTLVAAAGLSDEISVTLAGVVDLFDAVTRTPDGVASAERIADLAALCGCAVQTDPDGAILGWLVDVLLAPATPPTTPGTKLALPVAPLLETLHNAANGLAGSPAAIEALGVLAKTALVPARARLALPEVRDLFGSGALAALGDALLALGSDPCGAP